METQAYRGSSYGGGDYDDYDSRHDGKKDNSPLNNSRLRRIIWSLLFLILSGLYTASAIKTIQNQPNGIKDEEKYADYLHIIAIGLLIFTSIITIIHCILCGQDEDNENNLLLYIAGFLAVLSSLCIFSEAGLRTKLSVDLYDSLKDVANPSFDWYQGFIGAAFCLYGIQGLIIFLFGLDCFIHFNQSNNRVLLYLFITLLSFLTYGGCFIYMSLSMDKEWYDTFNANKYLRELGFISGSGSLLYGIGCILGLISIGICDSKKIFIILSGIILIIGGITNAAGLFRYFLINIPDDPKDINEATVDHFGYVMAFLMIAIIIAIDLMLHGCINGW